MGGLGEKIPNAQKGQTPSLVNANYANQLIDAVNALQRIEIRETEGNNYVEYSKENVILFIQAGTQIVNQTPGGMPSGFTEQTMYICENGVAVEKVFLIKDATT